jgi:hypothetical protein
MTESKKLGFDTVIAALREHGNKRAGDSEEDIVLAAIELDNETDRGAVILATTAFEDKLTERLLQEFCALNSKERNELFGFDAPLRSFSAKIRIAYALGVLNKPLKRVAEVVRVLRNTCAHSGQGAAFIDDALLDAIEFCLQEIGYTDDQLGLRSDERPSWPRFLFLTIINLLIVNVTKRAEGDEEETRPGFSEIYGAYLVYKAQQEQWPHAERLQRSPLLDHPARKGP